MATSSRRESLRVRLVLWYAAVLASVVAIYGGAVCYQAWRSLLSALDAELQGAALQVAASLRPAGDDQFDVDLSPRIVDFFRQNDNPPYYAIWNPRGELIDRSDVSDVQQRPPRSGPRTIDGRREVSVTALSGAVVLVGRSLADVSARQRSLILNVALVGIATLALAVVGGWFVASRSLAPIARISRVAQAMSAGELGARIPIEHTETELGQVASSLNDAFDRLQDAIEQQRRFTADASHELRTPISVIRAELDWALNRARTPQEYRQSLEVCRRATLRTQEMIEALLRTARAEAAEPRAGPDAVSIAVMTGDIVDNLAPLTNQRGVQVTVAGDDFNVVGDAGRLREALSNVIANAIQYNRTGGTVAITLTRDGQTGRIEVADSGIGIPDWAVSRVFDRFFRVDPARGRDGGAGAGLGLAVTRAIVDAHRGSVSCSSREGAGSRFVVTLPTC
jgi:two-component system OmpR family sensor kinase